MHSSLIPLLCYSSLGNSSFNKTRPILFSFDKNFPIGFQVAVTETWWHSVPSNLRSGSPSVWEKKNAWSQVKCPLKEMWRWRSLLAPFNLPTMIPVSHEENTEFSLKTEGQPLSGDKTVHRVLQVPTLTESISKIIYFAGWGGGGGRGQFGMRQGILEKYFSHLQCLPPGIWIHSYGN